MTVFSANLYSREGRIRGSYVYMLMCGGKEKIFIKVGQTCRPTRRLEELRVGCPFVPRIFATAGTPGRALAQKLERELHSAFEEWHSHGEWFAFTDADKERFNSAWQLVFERSSSVSWPLVWTKLAVRPIIQMAEQRRNLYRKKWATRGRAYQDFTRDLQSSSR